MSNKLDAIRARWFEVFGSGKALDMPQASCLARSDIPAMIQMLDDWERRFEMLGMCLASILTLQPGKAIEVPKSLVVSLRDQYRLMGRDYILTAAEIEEAGANVRITLKSASMILAQELETPIESPPSSQPAETSGRVSASPPTEPLIG